MSLSIGDIQVKPYEAFFGEDKKQVQKVTCKADVSSDLDGSYFWIYKPSPLVKYYVWLSEGGNGTDPAIDGATGFEVDYDENDSGTVIASKIAAVINADANFAAVSDGNVVTITNDAFGYVIPPRDGAVPTGFAFEVTVQGSLEKSLGALDGEIEWTVGKSSVDITAHQRGSEVLGSIMTGTECELTLNLKETTKEKLMDAFKGMGGSYIGEGEDATELVGFGQYKNFTNTTRYAARLVLHPSNKLASDKSEDVCFWLAFPMIESLTFSGEEILTIPVTMKVYPDLNKPEQIQHFAIGDWTQLV